MAAPSTTSTGSARGGLLTGGIAAIVFAVLFVVGFLLVSDTPDGNESNSKWLRYYADSSNRRMIIIGVILLTLAGIAFLIFLGVVRERLRGVAGSAWISTVAFASGVVFVAMVAVFAIGQGSVAASVVFGDSRVPRDADIMRTFVSAGFGALLLFGATSAGLLIFTTSVVSGRAALLPRWLVVSGYVAAVIVFLGGLLFLPIVLFVLWTLVVGIVMVSRSRSTATA